MVSHTFEFVAYRSPSGSGSIGFAVGTRFDLGHLGGRGDGFSFGIPTVWSDGGFGQMFFFDSGQKNPKTIESCLNMFSKGKGKICNVFLVPYTFSGVYVLPYYPMNLPLDSVVGIGSCHNQIRF